MAKLVCRECGADIEGSPSVCPSCGGDPTGKGKRRVLVLAVGIALVVIGLLAVVGGIFIVTLGSGSADQEGFRWSSASEFATDSYAGVVSSIDVDPTESLPPFLGVIGTKDVARIRVRATGLSSSKELFVGMAKHDDALAYFEGVRIHFARDWEWRVSPWNVSLAINEMVLLDGTGKPAPPKESTVWVASAWGEQTAVVNWTPEKGTYWVAVMNADGSPGVEASVELGASFPILGRAFLVMLVLGLVLCAGGSGLIYFGYVQRR